MTKTDLQFIIQYGTRILGHVVVLPYQRSSIVNILFHAFCPCHMSNNMLH